MSRINISEDEDYPGQFDLWQANCNRQINGKAGQAALRELEAALLALPQKRLIRNAVAHEDGDVCAVGALLVLKHAQRKGITRDAAIKVYASPEGYEPDDYWDGNDTADLAEAEGIPKLLAWQLVYLNDEDLDTVWEVACGPPYPPKGVYPYKGGIAYVREMTPEERYERVLAWVRERLSRPV